MPVMKSFICSFWLLYAVHFQTHSVYSQLHQLPTCTKITAVVGNVIREDLDTRHVSIATNVHLALGLRETACLYITQSDAQNARISEAEQILRQLTNVSTEEETDLQNHTNWQSSGQAAQGAETRLMYAVQYLGLQHLHPVRRQYIFGLPLLQSKCICDCPGGSDHCAAGYQYKNCTKSANDAQGSVCATTYFAHQPTTGCPVGFNGESELCCDVTARPLDNRRFSAVSIGQPDAVAEFRYQLFATTDGQQWSKKKEETFRVSLNKRQNLEFPSDRLEVRVSGSKPFYELKQGMYFFELPKDDSALKIMSDVDLRHGVPLNELHEYNLGRLGWFRLRNGRWTVRNALIRLQDAHKAQAIDCKQQTYTESWDAEYFVTATNDREDANETPILGHGVLEEEVWIKDITAESRLDENRDSYKNEHQWQRLIVAHRDSNDIELDLTMDSQVVVVKLAHHSSALADFTGTIQIDAHANRFLNLTLIEARGTMIGTVYRADVGGPADLAFSHYVGPGLSDANSTGTFRSVILALPSKVNSSRRVCMHPMNRPDAEICKLLPLDVAPVDTAETPYRWTAQRGDCANCNEATLQNFLHYLNPLQWFNGISSPAEALAMGVELLFYGAIILIAVALCRRVACPIVRWACCGGESCCDMDSWRSKKSPSLRTTPP